MTLLVGQVGHESATVIRPVFVRVPANTVNVRPRPVHPWRWTNVLVAPLELVAVAWCVPLVMLAVIAPVGLSIASLLWLGRLIISRF